MAKTNFKTVDEYITSQPESVRVALERVRRTIRKALPGAEEVISYQIPAYKLRGRAVLYFASWKQHYSIYPASEDVVAALGEALAPYELGKGTIRFPLSRPVPERLIARIARLRARKVADGERARTGEKVRRTVRARARPQAAKHE